MSTERLLKRVLALDVSRERSGAVDPQTLAGAGEIVRRVRDEGEGAVRVYAERFGERGPGEKLVLGRAEMESALRSIEAETRGVLERTAASIERFALAQRAAIAEVRVPIPGGEAGHTVIPIQSAGCYAPAGRYPLPSSVLMTAVTARVAGCRRVVACSPGAHPVMLAAAAIAGADEFLAVGGAHAVAALAHGFAGFEPCDVIAGPGNTWVTAAKQIVSGRVGIDMLAGPSELLVLADDLADARLIAADLLAQAEHDPDASAMLVTTSERVAEETERELAAQLGTLATRETARVALGNGFVCVVRDEDEMIELADRIAAEHVEILMREPAAIAGRLRHAGAVFLGANSPEVAGDYGAGPNHTLPTGCGARFKAGLSVMSFLRLRTWLRIDDPGASAGLMRDAEALARIEGLDGHARSARARLG